MNQVHKENLTTVENALPNRSAPDIEVFGMEGIPDDVLQQHNQRVSHEFFAAEAERRAATGNPAPGSTVQGAAGTKKPKLESPAELKARLAEHKARKAAEKSGLASTPDTPVSLRLSHARRNKHLLNEQADTATPPQFQSSFPPPAAAQAGSPPPSAYPPQPYGQAPAIFAQPQPSSFNYAADAPYSAPPAPFPPGQFGPPQPSFSPAQPYGDHGPPAPFAPPAQYAYPPHGAAMPPQSTSPPQYHSARQPPPMSPPTQPLPTRQNSLPSAPGLPQRPSFNAPHVSREQLAEMHSGNLGGPVPASHESGANATSVDDLISSAAAQQTAKSATPSHQPTPAPAEKEAETGSKKAKKATRLVYSDQEVSPEEKMAQMSKYAFTPDKREETYLGPVEAAVTGVVQAPDDVLDAQG